MLCNESELYSFLWMNYIPLYGYITFCLSVPQLDVWVVATFGLL